MGLSPNQSIGIIQSTNIHILIPDTRLCQTLALRQHVLLAKTVPISVVL